MSPYNSKNKLYKGITHVSKRTLDDNISILYKPYNSTTTNYQTAVSFADVEEDEYRIVLILSINPELNVYNYNDEYDEYEILLERNTIISNFVYNSYDKINKVHIYDVIVSKYNLEPLFIPSKASPNFLDLKIDKKSPKLMKIFDINANKSVSNFKI